MEVASTLLELTGLTLLFGRGVLKTRLDNRRATPTADQIRAHRHVDLVMSEVSVSPTCTDRTRLKQLFRHGLERGLRWSSEVSRESLARAAA